MDEVIFKNQVYGSATELANELKKTPNQIFNHLKRGTPIKGFEPECVDYKISREEWLRLANNKKPVK